MLDHALRNAAPPPALGPVRMVTAADEVADRLVTTIALGEFVPGERLPPGREMARLLGVSRSTVHEAVRRLNQAGIVEIRRGRSGGAFVRETWTATSAEAVRRTLLPRWRELEQLLDLRVLVEAMIARTAAERRTARQAEELSAALASFASATSPDEEHAADIAIHRAIVAAAGNPHISALSSDLLTRISLGFPIEPFSREVYERALAEHATLVRAVIDGEVEEAGRAARAHFALTTETLLRTLDRGLAGETAADTDAPGSAGPGTDAGVRVSRAAPRP